MPLFSKKNSKPGDTLYNKFEGTELEEFTRKHREDCNRIEHLAHSWTNSYGEAYQLGMSTENAKVFNGVHEAAYHLQGVKTAKEPMKSWTYNQMPHLSTMLYSEEDKLRDLEGRCGFTRDRSKIGRNEKLAKITAKRMEKLLQDKLGSSTKSSPKVPKLPIPHGGAAPDLLSPDREKNAEMMERRKKDWMRCKQAQVWRGGAVSYGSDRTKFLRLYHTHSLPLSRTIVGKEQDRGLKAYSGLLIDAKQPNDDRLPYIVH
mmetsp:Transcript_13507/g.28749  ORF Transcript_13507/g.28749 Transcript_13507/m.28749 type:complete len:259 (-) Transcript_13507:236-1012(-)|eukprot:CAMPEP_0118931408 /NCGR_PEP_ID=MMETSP1169-20130426/7760_1 /TAXON_ID=36882 /ORGANISM="Pyramimonas obovata, Strain CCMP722" /LENGTH=258 /DNA_ID=CAMNT_0006873907 /DNA_START=329 /DNA_END=1105 /DNA_ORIENTATION=+